ncbi:MAG: NADP-dependent isocitrate dehydrogenase [Desulfovibrionaceae bacterium]
MTPTVYYIEGDGIGPEVWKAARPVIDAALEKAYSGKKSLEWTELLAGKKAYAATGEYLPQATMDTLAGASLAMKGPLETPVGGGFRSLNVTIRQAFDLYACIRPVKYFQGIESPLKRPDLVDMVVFRENTEDVYAGIEWREGTPEVKRVIEFLREQMGCKLADDAGIGVKPITRSGSKRLVRKAIQYAIDNKRESVTLMHKGNIMKYTEGAFMNWGYEVAKDEFKDQVMTESEVEIGDDRIVLKDRIADALFQNVLQRPQDYDVIATTNLNGDYISDALVAQVGGLGLAPGVNMGDTLSVYEPTHGTAPTIAGLDKANPGSLILSGALMLENIGMLEAAELIRAAVNKTIAQKRVTIDLASQIEGSTKVGCQEFGELVGSNL